MTEKSGTMRTRRGILRRLAGERSGATSVEFGILAVPFVVLVFATLESCLSFGAQEVLANATDTVARQIRTGQVRAASLNETTLKAMICDRIEIVVASGCPGLVVDLQNYDTFAKAAAVTFKIKNGDIDTTGFGVNPGKTTSKNTLRVFYRWPVITNIMASRMSNLNGGKALHFASVTWQNEPFND